MSRSDDKLALVVASVGRIAGWEGRVIVAEPALPILASPSWRGVDGAPWRVRHEASGESLFVKLMDPDAALYIDVGCAFEAARRAADLGIGPRVLAADPATGVLVMADLDWGWRVGTLERLREPKIVDAVVDARRRFQAGPPLSRTVSVFDEIERFHGAVKAADATVPADIDWLVAELGQAAVAIRALAPGTVPIHGDGNVSNILISEAGEVRLVDWDRATNADPLEDLGSFLVEAFDQEPEARDAFTRVMGGFDEKAFHRAWVYGVADDLRWALIGALLAARSARNTLEFYKYASWRFVRCRMALREPRFGEILRRL